MQRLSDIIKKDRDAIFELYRDYTQDTELQVGSEKFTILASLQVERGVINAEATPTNIYTDTLVFRHSDISTTAWRALTRDAVIYVDKVAYTVVDTGLSGGIVSLSLKRGTSRGSSIMGRPI